MKERDVKSPFDPDIVWGDESPAYDHAHTSNVPRPKKETPPEKADQEMEKIEQQTPVVELPKLEPVKRRVKKQRRS